MDEHEFLLKQFNTFPARTQAAILKKAKEQLLIRAIVGSENPGALLEKAEQVKKTVSKSGRKKRKASEDLEDVVVGDRAVGDGAVGDGAVVDDLVVGAVVDDIFGDVEPHPTPAKKEKRKHGPHKCSICQKEGHTKKTCKENPESKKKQLTPSSSERLKELEKYIK